MVAFPAVIVADFLMMIPKAFPAKAAFAGAGPKAGRAVGGHEGFHDFDFRPAGRVVENSFHADGAGTGSAPAPGAVFRALTENPRARMAF